jgi:hypothetical protein
MHRTTICSDKPSSAKSDGPVSEIGWSNISKIADESSKTMKGDPDDWRTHLVRYLENTDHINDRKVQRQAMKYVMLDNTLYCQIIDGYYLNASVRIDLR